MAKPRSLLKQAFWDVAKRQRRCRHSKSHSIQKGERCLVIKVEREVKSYCETCGDDILKFTQDRLDELRKKN